MCSSEFGLDNSRKRAITHRELCSGKASGRDFNNHLRSCVTHLDFKPYLSNPDV